MNPNSKGQKTYIKSKTNKQNNNNKTGLKVRIAVSDFS